MIHKQIHPNSHFGRFHVHSEGTFHKNVLRQVSKQDPGVGCPLDRIVKVDPDFGDDVEIVGQSGEVVM